MTIDAADIRRVSAAVGHFSAKAGWTWKTKPVLVFEFAESRDVFEAKAVLLQAVDVESCLQARDMAELDCYGVSIRLVCKAVDYRGTA